MPSLTSRGKLKPKKSKVKKGARAGALATGKSLGFGQKGATAGGGVKGKIKKKKLKKG